ncbi:hypothetical protein CF327_g5838 [Tilletia walkeri]|nr:hypothetical protein CF327_g5838 [Tilletia walkeri]
MASDQPAPATTIASEGSGEQPHTQAAGQPRAPTLKFVGDGATHDDDDDEDSSDAEVSDDDEDDDADEEDADTYIALPDGPVASTDIENPLVSRIGGPPSFLPLRTLPPYPATTRCPNSACAQPMELLVQIFAPREDSPYDRCLHVWGCARKACNAPRSADQLSEASSSRPSVRVVRTLTFNPRWAAKLAKERARREEKERIKAEREQRRQASTATNGKNPFSMQGDDASSSKGSKGMLFGGDSDDEDEDEEDEDDVDEATEQADRLAEELQVKATLEEHRRIRADRKHRAQGAPQEGSPDEDDQTWPDPADVLAYCPPQYLNTIAEPYAQEEDEKAADAKAKAAGAFDTGSGGKGGTEGYERQLLSGMTSTFERFVDRVRREPSQVLRYAWDGVPLPYARRLAFGPADPTKTDTKKKVTQINPPPCERCGASRTFELQLMPNLINVLKPATLATQGGKSAQQILASEADLEAERADVGYTPSERAERARQREVARTLGRAPAGAQSEVNAGRQVVGLGWATAWVYVCSADCCRRVQSRPRGPNPDAGEEAEETWAEEWVALEFEQM